MARAWHPRLTTWVDRVDARWRRLGVPAGRRSQLRIDLVTDLSQARMDGAPLEELLAIDPDRFAVDVAIAYGWTKADADDAFLMPSQTPGPVPPAIAMDSDRVRVGRVVVPGILGSTVGGIVSLALLLPVIGWVDRHPQLDYATQALAMLAIYVTAALAAALSGGLAVASACADSPQRGLLLRRTTAGLILSGIAATIVTVGFASSTDYSTRPPVVLSEVGLVFGTCLVGLVLVARSAKPAPHPAVAQTK